MKKMSLCVLGVFIMVLITGCSIGEKNMEYDNYIEFESAVDIAYSEKEIEVLKKDIESESIDFNTFKKEFKIQCTRKTSQGFYSILKQQDNKKVFVFMDEKFMLNRLLVFSKFESKEDFDFIVPNKTKKSDVLMCNFNDITYPVSAIESSGYIVVEGLVIVRYNRIVDGGLLDDPVVDSIEFISNEDIEASINNFWVDNTPYILLSDKVR